MVVVIVVVVKVVIIVVVAVVVVVVVVVVVFVVVVVVVSPGAKRRVESHSVRRWFRRGPGKRVVRHGQTREGGEGLEE